MNMKNIGSKKYQINQWKYHFGKEIIDFDHFLKNFRLRRWNLRYYLINRPDPTPPNRSVVHQAAGVLPGVTLSGEIVFDGPRSTVWELKSVEKNRNILFF